MAAFLKAVGATAGFGRPDFPPELLELLTVEEIACCPNGLKVEDCVDETQQPFCDNSPCPGCDGRRKVLAFRELLKAPKH